MKCKGGSVKKKYSTQIFSCLYLTALFNFGKEVLGAHFEKQDVGTCLKLVKDVLVKKHSCLLAYKSDETIDTAFTVVG